MNKTTMKSALLIFLTCTLFFSCKKEESSQPTCETTRAGLAGTYKLVSLQYKKNASAEPVEYMDFREPCEKDDLLTLKSDGTYQYNDAGTTCSPNGSDSGSWDVKNNLLSSDGDFNGNIKSYDCKTLVFYLDNAIQKGDQMTYTLVKQ